MSPDAKVWVVQNLKPLVLDYFEQLVSVACARCGRPVSVSGGACFGCGKTIGDPS